MSCSDKVTNNKTNNMPDSISQRDELILYAITQDYKVSENDILNDLEDFLLQGDGDSVSHAKMSSRDDVNSKIVIRKNSVHSIPVKNNVLSNSKKAVNATENDEINLFLYETESSKGNGYAIVSDDMRVGEILCVVDGEFESDISDNEFMQYYSEALQDHIKTTIELWESITEKDIEEAKLKYGITDEDIANAQNGAVQKRFWGWTYGEWEIRQTKFPLKTQWGEDAPYNLVAEKFSGYRYLMGTPTVAVSQLMAYYNYPQTCNDSIKQKAIVTFDLLKNWDGKYDWNGMTKSDNIENCDENSQLMIGTLLYQNKMELYESPLEHDDRISLQTVLDFLRNNGFEADDIKDYNFDNVDVSVSCKRPVLVSGYDSNDQRITKTKHGWWIFSYTDTTIENDYYGQAFWIIDAIRQKSRYNAYSIFWIPFWHYETKDFIHCNFGKDGKGNGWYYSGVFDIDKVMTDAEVAAKSVTQTTTSISDKGNYAYKLRTICNIYPKNGGK